MTHDDYVKALDKDRDYAIKQRDMWAHKEKHAKNEHEKWQKQVDFLVGVYARASISGESAFSEDKK